MSGIKLQGSNLFATFKTEKELKDYIESHSLAEERRLLWLGVMFGSNHLAHLRKRKRQRSEFYCCWARSPGTHLL